MKNFINLSPNIQGNDDIYIEAAGYYERPFEHKIYRKQGEIADEAIVIFCIEGKGWLDLNERIEVKPGMMIFIDHGLAHGYGTDSQHPWTICWVHFGGRFSRFFAQEMGMVKQGGVVRISDIQTRVHELKSVVFQLIQKQNLFTMIQGNAQLRLTLLNVISDYKSLKEHGENRWIETKSRQMMCVYLDKELTVDMLAQHVNLSKYYYIREFKRLTGVTPMKYFQNMRMNQAKELLKSTDMSIGEISRKLNYSSSIYFSECFKKLNTVSPRTYKKIHNRKY